MPPIIYDRSYTVEELNQYPYRSLQQMAKSMSLPANVKKVVLIELINAKTTKSQAELETIVQRVKYERLLSTQAKGKTKKNSKLQGNEVSSTTRTQSPPVDIKPKVPKRSKSSEFNEFNWNSVVTYKVKQPVSPRKTSDRVLRSTNVKTYKRPNYSMINDPLFELDEKLAIKKEPNTSSYRRAPRVQQPPVQAIIERSGRGNTERLSLIKKPAQDDTKHLVIEVSSSTQTNEIVPSYYTKPNKYTNTFTKQEPETKNFAMDKSENDSVLFSTQRNSHVFISTPLKREIPKYVVKRSNGKISKINAGIKKSSQRIKDETGETKVTIQDIININIDAQTLSNYNINYKRQDLKNKGYQRRDTGNRRKDTSYQRKDTGNQRKDTGFQRQDTDNQRKDTAIQKQDTGNQRKDTGFQRQDTGNQRKDTGIQRQDTGYESEDTGSQMQDISYQDIQNINHQTEDTRCQGDNIKNTSYQMGTNYQRQNTYNKWQDTNYKWQDTYYQDLQRYYPNMSALSDVMAKQRILYRQNNAKVYLNKIRAKKGYKCSTSKRYQLPNPYNKAFDQSPITVHDVFGKLNEAKDITQPLYVEVDDIGSFGGVLSNIVVDPTPALLLCPKADMHTQPDLDAFSELTGAHNDTRLFDVQVDDSGIIVEVPPFTPNQTSNELRDYKTIYATTEQSYNDQMVAGTSEVPCNEQKPLPKIHEAFSKFSCVKYENKPLYVNATGNHFNNNGEGFEKMYSYRYPPSEHFSPPKMFPTTCSYDVPCSSTPDRGHGHLQVSLPVTTIAATRLKRRESKKRDHDMCICPSHTLRTISGFELDKDNHFEYTVDEVSNNLVPYTEQEMTLRKYNEVLSRPNSAQSQCSHEMDDALELISQDGEYMARIHMDLEMQCVLCSWAGAKIFLHHHILKEHSADMIIQGSSEWAVTFALGRLASEPAWVSHVSEYKRQLYVVSAHYRDPDCFMASFTTLSADGEPKMGTITVYNKVTGEPYDWHGQIPELASNMPDENGPDCLTVELAKLDLLPNSANIKLHNRALVSNSPSKVIVGEPELNDIQINIFVQVHN